MQNLKKKRSPLPFIIFIETASHRSQAIGPRMKEKLFALILAVAALAFAGALPEAKAAGSALDPTFGTGGELTIQNAAQLNDSANAVVVQPDGKIIVGGDIGDSPNSHAVLLRLNPNGGLDQTFGTGGRVVSSTQSDVGGIALQADGKILVAGGIRNGHPIDFALARYNADGSLDQTFGAGGFATLGAQTFTVIQSDSKALVVQPDGKIVVAGFMTIYPNGDKFAIARFNTNGSLDQSFGTNGSFITTTSMNDRALAVALQANGKIVASGYATTAQAQRDFALARYNSDGTPDMTFGVEGKLTTNFSFRNFAYANGVAIQPDGKIVAVGGFTRFNDGFLLTRYDDGGHLDQTFGTGGRVTTTFGSGSGDAQDVMVLPDGKLIVAGSVSYNGTGNEAFVLARYNANGSFDQNFGTNGFLITDFNNALDSANALALQPDGKLVLAGYAAEPGASYTDFALARYAISSPRAVVCDFDGDGTSDLSVFRPNGGVWYLQQSATGFRAQAWGADGDQLVPADYDGDRRADIAVFRQGNWYILNSADNTMRAALFGQSGDVPVAGDYDGDGKADPAVFRQGTWYALSSSNGALRSQAWGRGTDRAVPADYDGDGKVDYAVFRDGTWYTLQSSDSQLRAVTFGQSGDVLVAGDYDGDSKADVAVFRHGNWYVLGSSNGSFSAQQFGLATDRAAPADYDGDGRWDIAVFRNGTWYIRRSSNGSVRTETFGASDDVPVSSAVN